MNLPHDGNLLRTILALFAVMGILTLPPVFIAATSAMSAVDRRKVAFQCTLAVAVTLLASFFFGIYLIDLFNIGMDAFKVAGALVVANMAWGMITARPSAMLETGGENPAVIPLAIPKTAGPGAIATVIALDQSRNEQIIGNVFAIAVVTLLTLVFMLGSGFIERTLGKHGLNILARVFGLLLLAIAVTSIMGSLLQYFPGWDR